MRATMALAALLLVGTASGCASWTVKSERVAAVSLDQYRTFAWSQPAGTVTIDPLIEQRVRDQVTRDLGRRGIVPAAAGAAPDFLVDYRMTTGALYQTIVQPQLFAAPGASGGSYVAPLPSSATYTYDDARLSLAFIDARSGRVFWHGFASYATDRPAEAVPHRAEQAVNKILRKYG